MIYQWLVYINENECRKYAFYIFTKLLLEIDCLETLQKALRTNNPVIRFALCEFIGTFFLCLVGNGAVHQGAITGASNFETCFAFGFGVSLSIYISSPSGGHLNPAVSAAMAVMGRFGDGFGHNLRMFAVYTMEGGICSD